MSARLHPDLWFEFVTGEHDSEGWSNLTTYRWSTRPLADAGTYEGGWKEGRVESWEPIERTLSDPSGHYESSRFGCTIRDTDRLLRGLLGGLATEHLVNREASVKLISTAGRAASTAPRIIGRGKIRDPQPLDNLRFKFSGEDIIGADLLSGTKTVPQRTITRELFPDVHRDLIGKPQPILYGEVSDDGALDEDGEPAAKGLVPVFWVGTESIAGETWDRYLVAGHACLDVHSWFASDLGTPATRAQMDASTLGVDFLIPGQASWPHAADYVDLTDTTGVVHRVTLIYCRGERSEAHKSGAINITVNACGVEDVGDCSGELIRHGFRVMQHCLHHWVFANDGKGYYTGVWGDLPEWSLAGPTVTVMKTETFVAAQTFSAARLGNGTGYLCDFVLVDPIDVRELVRRFNVSLDCFTGINRHAQVIVAMLDDAADTSEATVFRDRIEIQSMPPPKVAHDEIENYVQFAYDFDADKTKFRADQEFLEDTQAQDALGGEVRKSDLLKFYMVRDAATARDAAARRLLRLKRAPRYQEIVLDLTGLEHDLTEMYRVTHYAGLGSSGYVDHPFFCVRHKFDPNTMTVTLTGYDVSRITAVAAPALEDEGGAEDGFLLGDEESSAAPPTGAYELRSSTYTPPAAAPSEPVEGAIYVSTAGNNANPGTEASPKRNVRHAVAIAAAGDTVYIRTGTYTSADDVIDSATYTVPSGSAGSPVTIAGYPGETVTLQPPDGLHAIRLTTGAPSYLVFEDLDLDGSSQTQIPSAGGPALVYLSTGAHHNVFRRLDVHDNSANGCEVSNNGGVSPYNEFLDCTIYDNGRTAVTNTGYGIYTTTGDTRVQGCEFYGNNGYGVHHNPSSGGDRMTVIGNWLHGNATHGVDTGNGTTSSAILVARGSGHLVANNLVTGNSSGITVYTNASGAMVAFNTVVGNTNQGIWAQDYTSAPVIRNNISTGNAANLDIKDYGGTGTPSIDHNHTTADGDPEFSDAGADDYHLTDLTPASIVGAGLTVSAVTTDYDGVTRPQGGAPDVGAYEKV